MFIKMSVQTVANRWIENGITQTGIKPILNNAFETLTTSGPGYCNENINTFTSLPGQPPSANQIILEKEPYGPANCNQYATLIKPGVNPLTLRGISNSGVSYPVDDTDICLQSCDYMSSIGPVHGVCSQSCIRSTQYCVGNQCDNNAPGGLADWMGRPKSGSNNGTWGSAINNQLTAGTIGSNGYDNPIKILTSPNSENLMKYGFVTQGCECQPGTSRIAGGTFYDWAQLGPGTGPFTLNTDSGISSEVWNGQGSCNTWENSNQVDITQSTCNLNIQKYAQTCAWCKTAVLSIANVQPDQKYPPEKTTSNLDAYGNGTTVTSPTYCTFSPDKLGNYNTDNGDCLGYGVNGNPRIPCNHPIITALDCPKLTPDHIASDNVFGITANGQKIGLLCNVPAGNRLTGASCGFVQAGDLTFMTIATGSIMQNYSLSITNGSLGVSISGSVNNTNSWTNGYGTPVIGGRQIAITFPNGTTAQTLLNYLKSQTILTREVDIYLSDSTGASASNSESSIPPGISTSLNVSVLDKIAYLGGIEYIYRYSSSYPGYTGSYFDGPIQINYIVGSSMSMTVSGSWNGNGTNVINITFPNNTPTNTLVNFLNSTSGFQNSSLNAKVKNLQAVNYLINNTSTETSGYTSYYYIFAQSGNNKSGGITDPGNCNIHLDGTKFTGTWMPNAIYTDPTTGATEPWIGKQGIKCDYFPNQGSCQTMFYDPSATDDCQICDSDLWDWIPGGVDAVIDPSNTLHNLALTAYIPKFQNLKYGATCNQTSGGIGSTAHSVSYCGQDNGNNRCANVCGDSCAKMSWDTSLADSATDVVRNLANSNESGIPNANLPGENCPDVMCERNPVLTLRGTSEAENNQLVTNWMNGIFDLTSLHGNPTGLQNPIVPDLRVSGQPDEIAKRTIKAMRCCLGINPGFQSNDGGANGGPKTGPDTDPYGGLEIWNLSDCPPGVMCPSSDTCKNLFKSVLDGSNQHITMNLNDFGSASYPNGFSLDTDATSGVSEDILSNPAYYTKAYCEMMSGGSTKTLSTVMGLDDEINTLCRKTMYNYCISPVTVDVINTSNYWNAPIGASTPPTNNANYSKTTYELPLKIFTQGCNMWFKNELQEVMPSDYGTRDMLLGSACQRLQVDGWYNPIGPAQSPLLQAFVSKDGKIQDSGHLNPKSGIAFDLSYIGSASATSGDGSIPSLLANTCNCFLLGSKCNGSSGSNCSYQYCGTGTENEVKIDLGNPPAILNPLNTPVDLTPYTSKIGSNGIAMGDSSWTKYQDTVAPSWTTGIDTTNFTCAKGNAPQGMVVGGNEAGGSSNCYTNCNYVNEYDVCWNASPTNRKYSGELLGGNTKWNCNFNNEGFTNINSCDPSQSDSYSCFGDCEHGNNKNDGSKFPSCGTQTWFDNKLSLNPGEIKTKQNRSPGRSDVMDTPYWQNFYSGASEQVSSASIPNIGSIYNPSRSILASDSVCGSLSSIKPYNLQFASQNQCVISQAVSVNNQGIITGSVGVSQLGSCNVSNIFQGHDQYKFLTYMGAVDCTGQDTTCWNNNNFCLTDGSTANTDGIQAGENCMVCGNSSTALIDAPTKSNTCCLDPSLGKNDKNYQTANANILNSVTLGDKPVVSYFCSSGTCPVGSTDLASLQNSCGPSFTCKGITDQTTCEGCQYCAWQPVYTSGPGTNSAPIDTGTKQCVPSCPTAPQNGWLENGITLKPTGTPTSIPTSSPTTKPTTAPIGVSSNLSSTDIALIVIGIVILLAFFTNFVVVMRSKGGGGGGGSSFGKVAKRGLKGFAKKIRI